jgi:hypothetical protein
LPTSKARQRINFDLLVKRLGIILGAKIFINFCKYPFEECIRKLRLEVSNAISSVETLDMEEKSKSQTAKLNHAASGDVVDKTSKFLNWTNEVLF